MSTVSEGEQFPSFSLTAWSGEQINLADLRGMIVVLYCYPEDNTPGCITEATTFTDLYSAFTEHNAEIIGVSIDSAASHREFAQEHNIGFPLVTDEDGALIRKLGIVDDGGRAKRTTFVIDRDGEVARVFENVQPEGHAEEVLEVVKNL